MVDLSALLQSGIGVLDFRERTDFDNRHIRYSLHIPGISGLLHRFSWLPPPKMNGKPGRVLLAICRREDELQLSNRLNRWNLIAFVYEDDEEFWKKAEEQGRIVSAGQLDEPGILFEPSAIVELAVQACEVSKDKTANACTVLDLGCGAARDIAWIVRRKSESVWLATGLDNLHATIRRAALLQNDLQLGKSDESRIERLIWAQATEQGSLQALEFGFTSKSKGVAVASNNSDGSLASFAAAHLPHSTYDLILLVRFLPRPLLLNLPALSHDKTIVAISHFTTLEGEEDYSSPDSSKRFEAVDVDMLIECWGKDQWRLLDQIIHRAEDGRPIRSVLFQKAVNSLHCDD